MSQTPHFNAKSLIPSPEHMRTLLTEAADEGMGFLATNQARSVVNKGHLELLKFRIGKVVEAGKHAIELDYDRVTTQITDAYTDWVQSIGGQQKANSLLRLNEFSAQLGALKEQIRGSAAQEDHKEMLIAAADTLWRDMYKMVFKNAARELENREQLPGPGHS